jgi:hypothetical protein
MPSSSDASRSVSSVMSKPAATVPDSDITVSARRHSTRRPS